MSIWILPAAFAGAIGLGWVFSYLYRTRKFSKNGF
jgi:hypothetical protein